MNESRLGLGIAIGVALGAAIGVSMDDMAAGMGVGITLGVAIGVVWQSQAPKRQSPDDDAPGDSPRDDKQP